MNAASHVPSGVLMVTSVSTRDTAPGAGTAAAARPAATDKATKSRLDKPVNSSSCFSSVIVSPLQVLLPGVAPSIADFCVFAKNDMLSTMGCQGSDQSQPPLYDCASPPSCIGHSPFGPACGCVAPSSSSNPYSNSVRDNTSGSHARS